jgi:hypothetical protein
MAVEQLVFSGVWGLRASRSRARGEGRGGEERGGDAMMRYNIIMTRDILEREREREIR